MRDVGDWCADVERELEVYVQVTLELLNHNNGRAGWFVSVRAYRQGPCVLGEPVAVAQGLFPSQESATIEGRILRLLNKLEGDLGWAALLDAPRERQP